MEPVETAAFVPHHVRASRIAPETVAMTTAGALAAAMGAGGLYPQLDDGKLRWLVGALAGALAAFVVRTALRGRTSDHAALRALGLSAALGVLLAFTCGVVLYGGHGAEGFLMLALFAFPFGGIPGTVYGVPLLVIAATARTAQLVGAADAVARARRTAGLVTAFASVLALLPAVYGMKGLDVAVLLGAAILGCAIAIEAQVEVVRRAAWVQRVRRGDEPFVAVRPRRPADVVDDLPRLTGDDDVLELVPDVGAYRANAARTPLALV